MASRRPSQGPSRRASSSTLSSSKASSPASSSMEPQREQRRSILRKPSYFGHEPTELFIDKYEKHKVVSWSDGPDECMTCGRVIRDEVTIINGEHHHSHCFKCQNCHHPISSGAYYIIRGRNYCRSCKNVAADRCHKCKEIISQGGAVKLRNPDRLLHSECFTCSQCGKVIEGKYFADPVTGKFICEEDYLSTCDRCHGCGDRIVGPLLRALGAAYHPGCFVCALCPNKLGPDEFFVTEGTKLPICKLDYEKYEAKTCDWCRSKILDKKGIETSNGKFYHQRCHHHLRK